MGRLQTARLENFIRRWGSIKGPGSVLSETLGDVFPILDLENLTPENHLPAGWTQFFGFIAVTGVAAQLTAASCRNLAGSGTLIVVDKIIIKTQTTQVLTVGNTTALFSAAVFARARDTRRDSSIGGVIIGANANAAAAETGFSVEAVAGVDRELTAPGGLGVLAPNTQLAVVSSTVNLDITVTFFGRARQAEPSELSF